tara:strand:+ start:108 stop:305 length:198 start_codon:yes stop_codon:yes gene_type:complete
MHIEKDKFIMRKEDVVDLMTREFGVSEEEVNESWKKMLNGKLDIFHVWDTLTQLLFLDISLNKDK